MNRCNADDYATCGSTLISLWLTSTQIQSGGKQTEIMLMFCDRDIHTTDT